MLVACRLAGLSALEAYYAGVSVGAIGGACGCAARFFWCAVHRHHFNTCSAISTA